MAVRVVVLSSELQTFTKPSWQGTSSTEKLMRMLKGKRVKVNLVFLVVSCKQMDKNKNTLYRQILSHIIPPLCIEQTDYWVPRYKSFQRSRKFHQTTGTGDSHRMLCLLSTCMCMLSCRLRGTSQSHSPRHCGLTPNQPTIENWSFWKDSFLHFVPARLNRSLWRHPSSSGRSQAYSNASQT